MKEEISTRKRRSLSARSYSKGRNKIMKCESSDEAPPCTDGWRLVIVNSPTSATEEVLTDDEAKQKEGLRRSPSFVPDYPGGEEPQSKYDREDQTSPQRKRRPAVRCMSSS